MLYQITLTLEDLKVSKGGDYVEATMNSRRYYQDELSKVAFNLWMKLEKKAQLNQQQQQQKEKEENASNNVQRKAFEGH